VFGRCQAMTVLSLAGMIIAVRRRQSHWLAFKVRKRDTAFAFCLGP
jgi:hypothetical protein